MTKKIQISEDEYLLHREEYDGVCTACGEITYGGVEPDAHDYQCEACGESTLMGIEEALMEGILEIGGESDKDSDYLD